MEFEERGNYITIPHKDTCLIYFLLQNNEVVYVGKSTIGIARPFMHTDKQFDTVKILFCKPEDVDLLEDTFIDKYKPLYNKSRNYAYVYSIKRTKIKIKKLYDLPNFNIRTLRKILRTVNINTFIDEYTGNECITSIQFNKLCDFIEKGVV